MAKAKIEWAYGIRTWGAGGQSHGGFAWDLTIGARTTAPDWAPTKECGQGLHANRHGMEDWSLLGELSDVRKGGRVLGVVRWDAALAIDLDGKHKAPWMEIVLTTETADLASVLAAISKHRNDHIFGLAERLAKQPSAAATTGDGSAAATTGYGSAAATTGDGSAAATTGDGSAAATTGDGSAAATTGNRSAAATTGYGSAAATTGNRSAAATTGDGSAAATTGDGSAAATTGYGSAAATTGNRSAAATTGDGSAAATTGYGSAAATTGDGSAAATTGDGSAAATTGDGSAAATTGNRSAAATTGYGSAAATTGKYAIAAALGIESTASAGETGAIMLAAWELAPKTSEWQLKRVFAGMVGETHGGVTIKAGATYRLGVDGALIEVAS